MAIPSIQKTCRTNSHAIARLIWPASLIYSSLYTFLKVAMWGLPLPGRKNLINLAFSMPRFRHGEGFSEFKFYFYMLNNQ